MVLAFIEGSTASQRFHRSVDAVHRDEKITELAFVCVNFCEKAIERISELLSHNGRSWKSVLISSCSGLVSAAIGCVLQNDVESIELRSLQSFDEKIGHVVGEGISSNGNVKKLTLSILTLRSDTILAMAGRDGKSNRLQSLRLSCCTFPTTESVLDVAKFLSKSSSLETLKLDSCKLEDEQMAVILSVIRYSPSIKEIFLPYNKCGSVTIQAISHILSAPDCQIRTLDCGRQYVEEDHIDYGPMMSSLKDNTSLRSLNISYTRIGCNDVTALASTLRSQKSSSEESSSGLETLFMCGNQMTLESIQALSSALPHTESLKRLWLTGTQRFGGAGIISICEGLRHNMSLEEVLLPPWLPEHANEIEYYTDINRGGRKLLRDSSLPSSVWPYVLNRVNHLDDMGEPDIMGAPSSRRVSTIYYLLRNKVLLEEGGGV